MVNNWVVQNNEGVVNTETGEFFDNYSEFKNSQDNTIKDIRNETQFVKQTFGVQDKKDTHYLGWNNNKGNPTYFTKNYKTYQRELMKDMDIFEMGMMSILSTYSESESNKVVIDKTSPTNKILEDLSGLGTRKTKEVISSLKNKNLVATIGNGRAREIYINPFWSFDGKNIEKKTLDIFGIKY